MFWTILITMIGLWSLCLVEGIGGRLIHVLLVIAALVLAYRVLGASRAAS